MDCYDLRELEAEYFQLVKNASEAKTPQEKMHFEIEASYLLLLGDSHNCKDHNYT